MFSSYVDFTKVAKFSNGVYLVNCTPHQVVFLDGENEVTVLPCGVTLLAKAVETPAGSLGNAQLVKTAFETSLQGEAELEAIEKGLPGVLILGSVISAQAYPGRVVAMISAPGFERMPPNEKRFTPEKFTIF